MKAGLSLCACGSFGGLKVFLQRRLLISRQGEAFIFVGLHWQRDFSYLEPCIDADVIFHYYCCSSVFLKSCTEVPTMSALASPTRLSEKRLRPFQESSPARHVRALVVSPELDVRKPLLRTLEALQVDTVVCSSCAQAQDILCNNPVDIVFCDERLPDGSYAEFLHARQLGNAAPRVVVTTRTGDWDLYFAALDQGAFDVIQSPCYAQDVEMTVLRLLTEESVQPLPSHPVS